MWDFNIKGNNVFWESNTCQRAFPDIPITTKRFQKQNNFRENSQPIPPDQQGTTEQNVAMIQSPGRGERHACYNLGSCILLLLLVLVIASFSNSSNIFAQKFLCSEITHPPFIGGHSEFCNICKRFEGNNKDADFKSKLITSFHFAHSQNFRYKIEDHIMFLFVSCFEESRR